MTKEFLVASLRRLMGEPTIRVELSDEDIYSLIDLAILFYAPYYTGTSFIWSQATGSAIDLTSQNVLEVIHVFGTSGYAPSAQDITIPDLNAMFGFPLWNGMTPNDTQSSVVFSALAAYRRSELEYQIDQNFRFIDGKLYLDDYSGSIAIECLKEITDISELRTQRAISWVSRYTYALMRVAVGEIRRKFTQVNAPFNMNGDTLVSEGSMDRQMLEEQVSGNTATGLVFVLR